MHEKTFISLKPALASIALASVFAGILGYTLGKRVGSAEPTASSHLGGGGSAIPMQPDRSSASSFSQGRADPRFSAKDRSEPPRQRFSSAMSHLDPTPLSSLDFDALFHVWNTAGNLDANQIESLLIALDEGNGGKETLMAKALLANQFGSKGGAAAAEYFLSMKDPHERNTGFAGAMVGWMRSNPDAAYAWLQRHEGELGAATNKNDLAAMYFSIKAKEDYSSAVRGASTLDDAGKHAVFKLLAAQAAADPERREMLLDSLAGQSDEKLTRQVQGELIDQLAWRDPAEAMNVIGQLALSDERRAELENVSLNTWASTDPQAAIQWQQKRLAGQEGAGDRIADPFRNWVGKDEAAASDWLRAQGPEFKTDLIFQKAGEVLQYQNPARAAEWQAQVFDDTARQKGYRKLYHRWKAKDPQAADAWKNSLPARDRLALSDG